MLETFGPERHTPEIRPSEIPCWLCMKCPPACPSGALRPVAAMKEANMGRAVIFKDRCLNWIESGTMCMTCYDRCPLRGEGMVPVSYTHLDVYKRQVAGLPIDAKEPLEQAIKSKLNEAGVVLSLIHI